MQKFCSRVCCSSERSPGTMIYTALSAWKLDTQEHLPAVTPAPTSPYFQPHHKRQVKDNQG